MTAPTEQLTTAQAAAYLNVSRRTLFRLADAGKVSRTKVSYRIVRWPKSALDRFIARNTRDGVRR